MKNALIFRLPLSEYGIAANKHDAFASKITTVAYYTRLQAGNLLQAR